MVRFGNFLRCLPAVMLAALSPGAFPAEIPVLNGQVTAEQWDSLPENPALAGCDSMDCAILRSIVTSFAELNARDIPNSMARREPKRTASEPISVVRYVHSTEKKADIACGMLSVLARSYFDWSVGLHAVEIASLLEPVGSGCVPRVVGAFPQSEEIRSLLANAADFCEVRGEAGCKTIAAAITGLSGSSAPHH